LPSKSATALLAGVLVSAFASQASAADGIEIPLDQVRIVTFASPVKTVYVGNPVIADVTVIDTTHVFLLGKNLGTTNIIALDAKGNETFSNQISVGERPGMAVTLQRGTARTTMSCTSVQCDLAPTPGDDPQRYSSISTQIGTREELAAKAAAGH
jgi:Flp pilus assembly secretin CpaC